MNHDQNKTVQSVEEEYAIITAPTYKFDSKTVPEVVSRSTFFIGKVNDKPQYILWGDSQAEQFRPIFSDLYESDRISGLCIYNRVPALGVLRETHELDSFEENKILVEFIAHYIKSAGIKTVVISSLWNYFLEGQTQGDRRMAGLPEQAPKPAVYGSKSDISADELFEHNFLATVKMMSDAGAKIYVIAPIPEQNVPPNQFCSTLSKFGLNCDNYQLPAANHKIRSAKIQTIFSKMDPSIEVLDPAKAFSFGNGYKISINGTSLYFDAHHLNMAGVQYSKEIFNPIISRLKNMLASAS